MRSPPAEVTVKFDFDHRPLPDIPLPNDIATRLDPASLTGLRLNASLIAPTQIERRTRNLVDQLDGWGVYQPITIPFTGPIDINSVTAGHRDIDYDQRNDVIYLVNITRDSDEFGRVHHLDIGNGNYPIVLERSDKYGHNDPREWINNIIFDETDEDLDGDGELDEGEDRNRNGALDLGEDKNGNGLLDPPEDSDADGVLDEPNYLPNRTPGRDDQIGRADALMSFYEKETNTLIVSPMDPLLERTTYAVIVTRRIRDADGDSVGSPFGFINHTAQTDDLEPLMEVMPDGLELDEIAFVFCYTTESVTSDWIAVREGLYEMGPQAHLGAEYPAVVQRLFPLKSTGPGEPFEGKIPFILNHEQWRAVLPTLVQQFSPGTMLNNQQGTSLLDGHDYIDFHAMGTYLSPQLFPRVDEDGNRLNMDDQVWPPNLHSEPAETRSEEIPFWVVVPRKEISVRGQNQQAPLVLLGHGYGSNRATELIGFAGYLAQQGIAVISTDNVSHGVPVPFEMLDQYKTLLGSFGLEPALDAVMFARGDGLDNDPLHHDQDLNRDGTIDSGVDFWTAYLFHMRDMVRQSALDYMQLIRVIRTWDGVTKWKFDVNGDGVPEEVDFNGDGITDLAGDFDGDGIIDVGSQSPIYVMGGSLGGIMATTLGSVEPEVEGILPIAGGGRLTDVGNRSLQGGVPEAVLMRAMGPLFLATMSDDGVTHVTQQATMLNDLPNVPIEDVPAGMLLPGDTIMVENLSNDDVELRCGYLWVDDDTTDGVMSRGRVALPADLGDKIEIRFYRGPSIVTGTKCELVEDAEPIHVINSLKAPTNPDGTPFLFEGLPVAGGELVALAEGFGFERATPSMRRFLSIAQMVVDPTDPGVLARHLAASPIEYPNKGDSTGARFLIVTSVGDMNVPASTGVTVGRAAGVIDYLHPHPDYGKPVNQVIIDTFTAEAVNRLARFPYVDPPDNPNIHALLGLDDTNGAHWDVHNFSNGDDIWGANIPRLDPGLDLMTTVDMWGNQLHGLSGAVFPYPIPQGQHGFALPGEMTDWAINICKETYGSTDPQCDDEAIVGNTFDVGWFMFHAFGNFVLNPTENPMLDACSSKEGCGAPKPLPPIRPAEELP